jgi:hypothetical protein
MSPLSWVFIVKGEGIPRKEQLCAEHCSPVDIPLFCYLHEQFPVWERWRKCRDKACWGPCQHCEVLLVGRE